MEFSSDPSHKKLLDKLHQVTEKSMEANLKYIQDVSKLFGHLAEPRLDLSDVTGGGLITLNQALTGYVATSTAYASQLLDLGMEFTKELMGNLGQSTQYNKTRKQSLTHVIDLKLSGQPGTICQTAFVLDNNRFEPIRAKFNYSMLIDSAGEHALDIPVQFNPPLVKLEHRGDKKRVIVGLKLPPDINFGLYHTILTIEGMPGLQYRLLVMVEESLSRKVGATKQKQIPKRTSGKKKNTAAKNGKPLVRK